MKRWLFGGYLIVQDELPYVTLGSDGGHVTFLAGPMLNNSILNVDHASIMKYEETKVMFSIGMEAGPMSEDDGGAKTAGTFGMVAEPTFVNGRQKWEFVEMKLMSLESKRMAHYLGEVLIQLWQV